MSKPPFVSLDLRYPALRKRNPGLVFRMLAVTRQLSTLITAVSWSCWYYPKPAGRPVPINGGAGAIGWPELQPALAQREL